MTLQELIHLSDSITDDREFLAHPDVRRVYWKCMGQEGPWYHTVITGNRVNDVCPRCGQDPDVGNCSIPPAPIRADYCADMSFADATEQLREVVAGRWVDPDVRCRFGIASVRIHEGVTSSSGDYIHDSARDRWIIFAAAAGGVESEGESR